jgi:hypothetical protein
MNNAGDLSSKLCAAIASLEADCTKSDVHEKLHPLIVALDDDCYGGPKTGRGLSPILVASDRGNLVCLEYLSKYDSSIVGSPMTQSLEENGGNTAVHHAAMVGCVGAWQIFAEIVSRDQGKDMTASVLPILGGLTNANGDTPLQMAVAAGQVEFIRQFWIFGCSSGEDYQQGQALKRQVLQLANHEGDTCVSLACGHGHVDIMQCLLEECQVKISHAEMKTCQLTVDRMDIALKTVSDLPANARSTFHRRQTRVHACLAKLKTRLTQQVEETAEELLSGDNNDNENQATWSNNSKLNGKKKSKKQKRPNAQNKTGEQGGKEADTACNTLKQEEQPFCRVSRLEDGRLAVIVQPHEVTSSEQEPMDVALLQNLPPNPASPQVLLRQRLKENHQDGVDKDVDAVMDALCLDVPMLLYTPHGMALNLSPSQLDAIEQILQKQTQAVRDARELQKRMHSKDSVPDNTVTQKQLQ